MKTRTGWNKGVGHRGKIAQVLGAILLWMATWISTEAQDTKIECEVCHNLKYGDSIFVVTDQVRQTKRFVCATCFKSDHSCELCRLPVLQGARWDLGDGRFLCNQDSQLAVVDAAVAKELLDRTKMEVQSLLSHWPPLPDRGIEFHLVNRADFMRQQRVLPVEGRYEQKLGLTVSSKPQGEEWVHQIYMLNGLTPERFQSVAAHELTHVWLHEHQTPVRVLHGDTQEGFCELVAHQFMSKRGYTNEIKTILANTYTRGQIDALLAAQSDYQFFRVIDWVLRGVDSYIESTNTQRLLVLRDKAGSTEDPAVSSKREPQVLGWVTADRAVKDFATLEVSNISGVGRTPLAMVNHKTLGIGERVRIKIAGTNWTVLCLDIQKEHVEVRIEETQEKRRLDLKP